MCSKLRGLAAKNQVVFADDKVRAQDTIWIIVQSTSAALPECFVTMIVR